MMQALHYASLLADHTAFATRYDLAQTQLFHYQK